jgi:hypothetical protein
MKGAPMYNPPQRLWLRIHFLNVTFRNHEVSFHVIYSIPNLRNPLIETQAYIVSPLFRSQFILVFLVLTLLKQRFSNFFGSRRTVKHIKKILSQFVYKIKNILICFKLWIKISLQMGFFLFLKHTLIIFAAHLATSCGAPFENHCFKDWVYYK